ncbi:hypothetical protein JK636_18580 [Clostridium sp. YIM B02515]|uniref:Uncharacterized protein n=1 Tax=Clostridium rhizosphaerae TaxID=2803861 RepID=A0ABS1TGH8_9CLOT|nr:hypothetical protein [Clostridium rhizosphaerae]MBL4937716.1 hypothetical protein [Clostridium rhizosphaerae]
MVELTERDIKILDLISEYGGIYVEDVKEKIYGSEQYYRRRIKKLIEENYLLRNNRILYLGFRGKKYLEENNKSFRNIGTDKDLRKRAAEIYRLFSSLESFTTIPSFKMERITKNYAYKYYGKAINKYGKEYWIYRIGKVTLKEDDEEGNARKLRGKELDIQRLKKELKEIKDYCESNNVSQGVSVMVFIEDKHGMEIYKSVFTAAPVTEELLIPYTKSGLALANKYIGLGEGENNIVLQKLTENGVNVKLGHSEWTVANFDIDGNYGVNLTTSDYKRELSVKSYLSLKGYPDKLTIVCAEAQKKKYESEFKGCNMLVLSK